MHSKCTRCLFRGGASSNFFADEDAVDAFVIFFNESAVVVEGVDDVAATRFASLSIVMRRLSALMGVREGFCNSNIDGLGRIEPGAGTGTGTALVS
jgi:hypothetical protein